MGKDLEHLRGQHSLGRADVLREHMRESPEDPAQSYRDPETAQVEAIEETTRIEAIERFRVAFDAFYTAGMALVEAWDDPDAVFNADVEWPLPPRIAPPLSLDEWLMELREHYYQENAAVSEEDDA